MRATRYHRMSPARRTITVATEDGRYTINRLPARGDDERAAIRNSLAVAR